MFLTCRNGARKPCRRHAGIDASRNRQTGGGLGLAIAKNIVQVHGGRLTIGEATGGGACLAADLPLFVPAPRARQTFQAYPTTAQLRVESLADEAGFKSRLSSDAPFGI